jgi:4a-hydroxytetrahydrobiopterin dehydratase
MTNNWKEENSKLKKTCIFGTFSEALAFVNQVAELSESANHHPDIRIYDYNKVEIVLTTHDKGKVTEKDMRLAKQIDSLSSQ